MINYMDVNYWLVLWCAVDAFILGAIWYSSYVFGKIWVKEARHIPMKGGSKHNFLVYIIAFIFFLISAYAFGIIIGPEPELNYAIEMGFIVGIGFAATSFGINYVFANRGIKLFLIDGGYHVAQFVVYGIIFGLWH